MPIFQSGSRRSPPARLFYFLLILGFVLSMGPAQDLNAQTAVWQKVHPILREMAAADGSQSVRVIVQRLPGTPQIAGATWQGGILVSNLSIINAVVLDMPLGNLSRLAADPTVRAISLDSPMVEAGKPCGECLDTDSLMGAYVQTIGATQLWNSAGYLQGQGVGVAVVDSGVNDRGDLSTGKKENRLIVTEKFNSFTNSGSDKYGHGSHIAGIIGGNGDMSRGAYIGVAPKVDILSLKVSDDRGAGTTTDLINGLQWVLQNKDTYNIRVVNISLNSSVAESYLTNPISAAVEILWFNGIVVVVSAGNNGSGNDNGVLYPPANDPFVITVGATDDRGTATPNDDVLASYSAYGITTDGFSKPDIVAPGTNIISVLSANGSELAKGHPSHRVDGFAGGKDYYFRMSGTSMATAVVSGAVALLLQDEPGLNPDQVKHRLMATARTFSGPAAGSTGAGYLDIYAAVHGNTTASANGGIQVSPLMTSGSDPITWGSVNWNSVNWNSVNWNSVNWNSVNWNSVNWNSVHWDDKGAKSSLNSDSGLVKPEPAAAEAQPRIYLPTITSGQ